jgi:hypothetical protein
VALSVGLSTSDTCRHPRCCCQQTTSTPALLHPLLRPLPHTRCPPAQVIDPHTHEYMARLRDEPVFLALCQKVHEYFGRIGDTRK